MAQMLNDYLTLCCTCSKLSNLPVIQYYLWSPYSASSNCYFSQTTVIACIPSKIFIHPTLQGNNCLTEPIRIDSNILIFISMEQCKTISIQRMVDLKLLTPCSLYFVIILCTHKAEPHCQVKNLSSFLLKME